MNLLLRIKQYRIWLILRSNKPTVNYVRGSGYYLTETLGKSLIGTPTIVAMESGKHGLYKLIDYEMYRDPSDMVKESKWQFIGYVHEKPINECTFKEFLNIYAKK